MASKKLCFQHGCALGVQSLGCLRSLLSSQLSVALLILPFFCWEKFWASATSLSLLQPSLQCLTFSSPVFHWNSSLWLAKPVSRKYWSKMWKTLIENEFIPAANRRYRKLDHVTTKQSFKCRLWNQMCVDDIFLGWWKRRLVCYSLILAGLVCTPPPTFLLK